MNWIDRNAVLFLSSIISPKVRKGVENGALEIPVRLVQFLPLHPGWEQGHVDVPDVELHLQDVFLRPGDRPSRTTPGGTSHPASASPPSAARFIGVPTLDDLPAPVSDLSTYLLQVDIIVHKRSISKLVHRDIGRLIPHTGTD